MKTPSNIFTHSRRLLLSALLVALCILAACRSDHEFQAQTITKTSSAQFSGSGNLHATGSTDSDTSLEQSEDDSDALGTELSEDTDSLGIELSSSSTGSEDSLRQRFTVNLSLLETSVRPVHMLWIVDNSDSMRDEIGAIRRGIGAFAEGLQSYGDQMQVTMITKASNDPLSVPASLLEAAGIYSINVMVPSRKKLHNLATYLNPVASSSFRFQALIGHPMPSHLADHPSSDFFRNSEALKAFVVVTDDSDLGTPIGNGNDRRPAGKDFHAMLTHLYQDLSLFRFFLFFGEQQRRDVSFPHYRYLMSTLGGKEWSVHGLSPEQWQQIFSETEQMLISEVLQRVFHLQHPKKQVLSVSVGGNPLAQKAYAVNQGKLHVTAKYLEEGDIIEVTYQN